MAPLHDNAEGLEGGEHEMDSTTTKDQSAREGFHVESKVHNRDTCPPTPLPRRLNQRLP